MFRFFVTCDPIVSLVWRSSASAEFSGTSSCCTRELKRSDCCLKSEAGWTASSKPTSASFTGAAKTATSTMPIKNFSVVVMVHDT